MFLATNDDFTIQADDFRTAGAKLVDIAAVITSPTPVPICVHPCPSVVSNSFLCVLSASAVSRHTDSLTLRLFSSLVAH